MRNNDVLKITARVSTIRTFRTKQKTLRLVKGEYKENLIGLALCYFKTSIYISPRIYYKLFCLHTSLEAGKLLVPKNKCVFTVSIIES